jgi:protein TonB
MPRFPGCEDQPTQEARAACAEERLARFIADNLIYPDSARQAGIEGVVMVEFVVEKDGSVGRERIVKGLGYGCEEAALRVIALMREKGIKWTGQRSRGRPVALLFTRPVYFQLAPTENKE